MIDFTGDGGVSWPSHTVTVINNNHQERVDLRTRIELWLGTSRSHGRQMR